MSYTTVSQCGNDHSAWLKSLDFYDEEFDILENRLVGIVKKNNGQEAMAGVEHFQNQFIVQRNNIDELMHSIKEHDAKVAADVKVHAGKIETELVNEHNRLHEQVDTFEKIVKDLRQEFNSFLSRWI